ncbi:hypothetical protein CEXT_164671 [Caerostris extrusa]|uniref:Uncharacterized protein n=1 Tax=Caerostris extrusa TaxID=172846 RepID=A0AAV4NNX5_CAEEX|nr:hypothetical protein CEXT_164671 [Caerostris extrusa]
MGGGRRAGPPHPPAPQRPSIIWCGPSQNMAPNYPAEGNDSHNSGQHSKTRLLSHLKDLKKGTLLLVGSFLKCLLGKISGSSANMLLFNSTRLE